MLAVLSRAEHEHGGARLPAVHGSGLARPSAILGGRPTVVLGGGPVGPPALLGRGLASPPTVLGGPRSGNTLGIATTTAGRTAAVEVGAAAEGHIVEKGEGRGEIGRCSTGEGSIFMLIKCAGSGTTGW